MSETTAEAPVAEPTLEEPSLPGTGGTDAQAGPQLPDGVDKPDGWDSMSDDTKQAWLETNGHLPEKTPTVLPEAQHGRGNGPGIGGGGAKKPRFGEPKPARAGRGGGFSFHLPFSNISIPIRIGGGSRTVEITGIKAGGGSRPRRPAPQRRTGSRR